MRGCLSPVMQGEVAYRQLVLREGDTEKLRLPLVAPVNDMLGWERPDGGEYATHLWARYKSLGFPRGSTGDSAHLGRAFLGAAEAATKGRIAADVAQHLARLRFSPDGRLADIPDFAALAAWSLLESVRRQPLKLW